MTSYRGKVASGKKGMLIILYWDVKNDRPRAKVGYIGEDGLKPDVIYKLNDTHEFEEITGDEL